MTSDPDPTAAKAEIRRRMLAERDALDPEQRAEEGEAALRRILALPEFDGARTLLAYASFGSELDTTSLLRAARDSGKRLALPRINKATGLLDLYGVADLDADLRPGVWGIPEPDPARCPAVAPESLDFVLMPGVAFDPRGGRVGYGRGFFDKLLAAAHQGGGRPFTVAAAFEFQVLDRVPMDRHDVFIDAIATASRLLRRT